MKDIGLVDCNNFFASCEVLFNPSLEGKPVCVLSNNDGCVIARSNEAKKMGIKMGLPYFMAKKQFPCAIYLSGNHKLYREISDRIMERLRALAPIVEVYSIDEAFIDLTGVSKLYNAPMTRIIEEIRLNIKNTVGIPVSVGLSNSKVLAKLASEMAKSNNGLYRISPERREAILKRTPVEDIWGVGRNISFMLKSRLIRSAYDISAQSDAWLKKTWGIVGVDLKHELLGEAVNPVVDGLVLPKSIQKTLSFAQFTDDKNEIKNALHYHCHRVCTKLRRLDLKTKAVGIMLRTKDFRVFTAYRDLENLTDSELEINRVTDVLLREIYQEKTLYRSCGVYACKFSQNDALQLSIFNNIQAIKAQKISAAWDIIEQKYGKNALNIGFRNFNKSVQNTRPLC